MALLLLLYCADSWPPLIEVSRIAISKCTNHLSPGSPIPDEQNSDGCSLSDSPDNADGCHASFQMDDPDGFWDFRCPVSFNPGNSDFPMTAMLTRSRSLTPVPLNGRLQLCRGFHLGFPRSLVHGNTDFPMHQNVDGA
jgi:hypothetical protein